MKKPKFRLSILLLLISINLYGQTNFKTDGVLIEEVRKSLLGFTDYTSIGFGEYGIWSPTMDEIMNLDVINSYGKYDYDTELKQKYYIQSDEYKKLLVELQEIKEKIEKSAIMLEFDGYSLSDYSLQTNSFTFNTVFNQYSTLNNKKLVAYEQISVSLLPISITRNLFLGIDYENTIEGEKNYFEGNFKIKVLNENTALNIENNKDDIRIYFISDIVSTAKSKFDQKENIYEPSFIRFLIFNFRNKEIYVDKVYSKQGVVDMNEKDYEKKMEKEQINTLRDDKLMEEQRKIKEINSRVKEISEETNSANTSQGSGVPYSLSGRTAISLVKPNYPGDDEGIVVVKVTVDKYGNVTIAEPGVQGTTIKNTQFWDAAKTAALRTKFNADNNAPAYQLGTISYRFVLD